MKMEIWIQQSSLHFELVQISEEPRLDGFPKLVRKALGEVKFEESKGEWDIALSNGQTTHFPTLEKSMQAVEILSCVLSSEVHKQFS